MKPVSLKIASRVAAQKTTFGKWATVARVAHQVRFFMITAKTLLVATIESATPSSFSTEQLAWLESHHGTITEEVQHP